MVDRIMFCLWPCSLAVPVLAELVYGFVVQCPGTPEGSTGSCSGFKASQKTGQQFKVSSDRLGEAGNRTCNPWYNVVLVGKNYECFLSHQVFWMLKISKAYGLAENYFLIMADAFFFDLC